MKKWARITHTRTFHEKVYDMPAAMSPNAFTGAPFAIDLIRACCFFLATFNHDGTEHGTRILCWVSSHIRDSMMIEGTTMLSQVSWLRYRASDPINP